MRFRAVLELNGKTATGIPVPPEVVAELGQNKRPAVQVRIGSHSYRSTIGVMGGRFLIPVSAEHRTAAGVAPGDEVDVEVTLDTAPREVVVPDDFAEALRREPVAGDVFGKLSYSHKQRWVLSITQAKSAQTRERRIAKAVEELRTE